MQGFLYGAGRGVRTHDLRFTKPLLYQLSYAGKQVSFEKLVIIELSKPCKLFFITFFMIMFV